PARRAPNRKSRPTRSQRVASPFTSTSSTKRSADIDAKRRSKRATCTRSTPAASISSSLSRSRVSRAGAAFGSKNSRGCGSKVSTHETSSSSRAFAPTRSMSARCPRCTPSKLQIVSAHRPGARCREPCVTTMDSVKTLNYSAFVKTLEEQMAIYAAYHRDPRNKATHFVGVPLIMLALLVPLSLHRFELAGFSVTPAMLVAAALLAYYFVLDFALAVAMLVVLGALIWLAELLAAGGAAHAWIWFGAAFVGGWILQLVGHVFEGRKPALVDNLFQIFIAPIFLCAEVFFALGLRSGLRSAVQARAVSHGSGN